MQLACGTSRVNCPSLTGQDTQISSTIRLGRIKIRKKNCIFIRASMTPRIKCHETTPSFNITLLFLTSSLPVIYLLLLVQRNRNTGRCWAGPEKRCLYHLPLEHSCNTLGGLHCAHNGCRLSQDIPLRCQLLFNNGKSNDMMWPTIALIESAHYHDCRDHRQTLTQTARQTSQAQPPWTADR